MLVMKNLTIVPNKNVCRVNYTVNRNVNSSFSVDITYEFLAVVTKMWAYATLRIPKDENDKNYLTTVFKTVINVEKAIKGAQSNYIMLLLVNCWLKSSEKEIQFPLEKVSQWFDESPFK
jgi:hypothetical protein